MGASGWLCLGFRNWCRHGRFARCVVVVMSAAQHTPGPWFVSTATHLTLGAILAVSAKEGDGVDAVCIVDLLPGDEESKANARLIAASLELLAELKKARAFIEVDRNDLLASVTANGELKADDIDLRAIAEYNDILASIDTVMTKAEGGAA